MASLSHGPVAFGFFHIESDMLLLERMFFFAGDLCGLWQRLAAWPAGADFQEDLPGFVIEDHGQLGDLHGAIAGHDLGGFLGALYARWAFPRQRQAFAQKPQGAASRQTVIDAMSGFGLGRDIPVLARPGPGLFSLGGIIFSREGLLALVDYVWRGGMPGWQRGRRPGYLLDTARVLAASASPWFQGLDWDQTRIGFAY
jgi:hypothetical protein